MRIAYGDLIGGVSGDMFVAALLDLGLSLNKLRAELKKIPTLKFELHSAKKSVHAIRATQFKVICPEKESPRSWKQIRDLIRRAKLNGEVKATGIAIFTRLAEAEAKIHGGAVDDVHFHEVGATDSIVDIMAAAIGVHELGIESFAFSRIPLGRGIVRSMHGPLPAPGAGDTGASQRLTGRWRRRGRRNGHAHRRGAHAHVGENVRRSTADDNRKDRLRRRTKSVRRPAKSISRDAGRS